jgi:protein-disulfide isomerase
MKTEQNASMNKRQLVGILVGVTLIASLMTGAAASGAQTPPALSEVYTWQPYNLSVRYPSDWTVVQKTGATSVRPTFRDVTDGLGPELVLFVVTNTSSSQLDSAIDTFARDSHSQPGAVASGSLDGHPTRTAALTWADSGTVGVLRLIAVDDQTVLGAAYIVRQSDAAVYQPLLEQMLASLMFGAASTATTVPVSAGESSSVSVASVQLPQSYTWDAAGLILHFPEGWTVNVETNPVGTNTLLVTPPKAASRPLGLIQATTFIGLDPTNLHHAVEIVASTYDTATPVTDLTVAGYPAAAYEFLDTSESPTLYARMVIVSLGNRDISALFIFDADQTTWDAFRPVVSAFISSIEPLASPAALLPSGSTIHNVALHVAPGRLASAQQQDSSGTTPFDWEEYGITFDLPEGWQSFPGGSSQNYDLALVSPEAASSGTGAFILLRTFATLGPGVTLESTMESVASQVNSKVTPYSVADLNGVSVDFKDDQTGAVHHLVLLPYGTQGGALYIQTNAPEDQDAVVQGILDSIVINPPVPDFAAVDAAWKDNLASDGKLLYGDQDAPIKMVEFLDFSCSHCAEYSSDVERLIALEVPPGHLQIEIVPMDIIGGPLSNAAAQATYCAAEQGKGYTAFEALFQNYINEGRDVAYSRDGITKLLGDPAIGLDIDTLNACLDANTYSSQIATNNQRAEQAGVNATPSILLATGDNPPAFLKLPDGTTWAGGIPIEVLRSAFKMAMEQGMSLQDAVDAYLNQQSSQ